MTKEITFDVKITQNRRFTLPYDVALKLIEDEGEDYSNWNKQDIAEYLFGMSQEIVEYEDEDYSNSYWDNSEVTNVEITE